MRREGRPIVIIGAGLAGVVCARLLLRAGLSVVVLEREETMGGRVRTTVTAEGYRIDRGFQVLFAAYPALLRHVALSALEPRYFRSGTYVVRSGRMLDLGHPLYDARSLPATVSSGLIAPRDAAALTRLLWKARGFGDAPLPAGQGSTHQTLQAAGISETFIRNVAVPFFGGVSFDRSLSTDAAFFGLVLRTLAVGRAFLPAYGVQRLPELLAADFPAGTVEYGRKVDRVLIDGNRVVGVETDAGIVASETVVVATEAQVARELTGISTPSGSRSSVTAYFSSDRPLYEGAKTVVHAEEGLVNEIVQLTNVAPEYAPSGRHLLSATVLRDMEEGEAATAAAIADDIRGWFPRARNVGLEPVAVVRVPYAQFDQPPGIYGRLPTCRTATDGLFLAGEYLHSSSIQGAIRGGEMAADAVLASISNNGSRV